jgi:SAM-dependent MidA family methyltransferase
MHIGKEETLAGGSMLDAMPGERSIADVLRNLLQYGDLPFRDFVEIALYHPELGYYAQRPSPVGKEGDFVTGPLLSPAFSYALNRLVGNFVERVTDGVSTIVDVGCGDGSLINTLCAGSPERAFFAGVDRAAPGRYRTIEEVPQNNAQLVISNELFDALPFARLVQRADHLSELWVTERDGQLDWSEHEAEARYVDYFASRGIELDEGQFADISLDWAALYGDLCRFAERGLIVTFDYGYPQSQLFRSRMRRFGTAAAYSGQRVSRDLLANPGRQDLTAHINFDDLRRTGESSGFTTLFFDRQAKFLLSLGITEHELFRSVMEIDPSLDLMQQREDARRLVLPDGIGEDIRVLVQGKGIALDGWSFQRKLF